MRKIKIKDLLIINLHLKERIKMVKLPTLQMQQQQHQMVKLQDFATIVRKQLMMKLTVSKS
jgi:hypothetical protein